MALIRCPECGREISDKAVSCPGCGYPLAEQPDDTARRLEEAREKDLVFLKKAGIGMGIGIVIILAFVFVCSRWL